MRALQKQVSALQSLNAALETQLRSQLNIAQSLAELPGAITTVLNRAQAPMRRMVFDQKRPGKPPVSSGKEETVRGANATPPKRRSEEGKYHHTDEGWTAAPTEAAPPTFFLETQWAKQRHLQRLTSRCRPKRLDMSFFVAVFLKFEHEIVDAHIEIHIMAVTLFSIIKTSVV